MKLNLKNKKDIDDKVLRTIIQYGLGFASRVKNLEERCIDDWESDKLYDKSSFVIYDGYIWKAKVTNQSSTWDEKYWTKLTDELSLIELDDIKAMLNLTDEQLKTLSSIILDSEIRLDKTFSSSKIYTDIQQCLSDSKAYTLQELAKKTGASYKIVTNITDVTSTEYLYLLANANNAYDIYALIDGTAQKIGDTTIDLSQFYTKNEVDNDFLKTADADSKYTNQTSFNNHVVDTDVHTSATEKATYALKSNITDLINSSSTSEQMASAIGVYKELINIYKDGVGLHTTIIKSSDDLNSVISNTFLSVLDGALNSPDNTANFFGISMTFCNNFWYTTQILLNANENQSTTMNRTIWIRNQFDGTWTDWFHITPSKTSDVAVTKLISENSSCNFNNADSHFDYCVHNGVCYVNVWSINCTNAGGEIILSTKLPVGIMNCVHSIHTNNSSTQYTIVGQLYTNGGILKLNIPQAFERGYCSFSYPVA